MADYTILLTDIATDTTLADFSNCFIDNSLDGSPGFKISPRANKPRTTIISVPSDNPDVLAIYAGDGYGDRKVTVGTRALKVYRDGLFIAHDIVYMVVYGGDQNRTTCSIIAYSPLMRLASRTAWDAGNHLADLRFPSPMSGAEILHTAIASSITNEDLDIGSPKPLPIDISSGTFDTTMPPALDLSHQVVDSPITLQQLATLLTDTGGCDVVEAPVDTSMGADPGIMCVLSVVNAAGADVSAGVHFDYRTGDNNVALAQRSEDLTSLCNRLVYELGPKTKIPDRWNGNITGTETGAAPGSEDLTAYQADQLASRAKYGTYARTRVYASAAENLARKLFHQLWKTESTLGVVPRELLKLTPQSGRAPEPFADYTPFDTVGVNIGELLGPPIAGTQQIYGFDVSKQAADSVERVAELETSVAEEI